MTPEEYAELNGAYPDAPNNPTPSTTGFMDNGGFAWAGGNAESMGAESCTCNDMFGSLCPQCNYDSDREGGVCPKGCTVDLAGSVRPQ